jgi:hypothetical protein
VSKFNSRIPTWFPPGARNQNAAFQVLRSSRCVVGADEVLDGLADPDGLRAARFPSTALLFARTSPWRWTITTLPYLTTAINQG